MLGRGGQGVKRTAESVTLAGIDPDVCGELESRLFFGSSCGDSIMYAVIATGGKQYRVAEGDVIQVERLAVDVGGEVEFDKVLMVGAGENVTVGKPYIDGGKVAATVRKHGRGEKIEIVKMRRRKHHRKQMGHRQDYTEVQIGAIQG